MTDTKQEITEIYADKIIPPTQAMRRDFDEEGLIELANDIKQNGLTNAIMVRPVADKYEIVAGHRRYLAMLRIPWSKIPCIIRNLSNTEVLAIKAGENYRRSEVNPVDEAHFLKTILKEDLSNIEEVATLIGKKSPYILDRLEILTYPDYMIPAIQYKQIGLGVARSLSKIDDEQYRRMFFDQALRDGMKQYQADYYLAQWEAGVFKSSEDIMPADEIQNPNAAPKVRQPCAKCGGVAESPNLTSVFIHVECPLNGLSAPVNSPPNP